MAHQTKFQVFRKSARKFMSSSINLFIWLTYIWYWILELHCISGLGVVLKCSSKHIWWQRSLKKRPIHPKTGLLTNWAATACQMCMIRIWLTLPVKYNICLYNLVNTIPSHCRDHNRFKFYVCSMPNSLHLYNMVNTIPNHSRDHNLFKF